MKLTDYVVQERGEEFSRDCLHRPLFPVNMRLFHSSPHYHRHILDILGYMAWHLGQKWEDYISNVDGGTFGISCANLGMAYNIIGFRREGASPAFMINPVIIESSMRMTRTMSNCGSIRLKGKIPIDRHTWVVVEYYTVEGKKVEERFTNKEAGFTIQHEIDHNNGILITDRFKEQGGKQEVIDKL